MLGTNFCSGKGGVDWVIGGSRADIGHVTSHCPAEVFVGENEARVEIFPPLYFPAHLVSGAGGFRSV